MGSLLLDSVVSDGVLLFLFICNADPLIRPGVRIGAVGTDEILDAFIERLNGTDPFVGAAVVAEVFSAFTLTAA